jgi:putative nucleotidyltransferase with HDIG domain
MAPVYRSRLAFKITLPYAILALALALASLYVVARIGASSVSDAFEGQLEDARLRVADSAVRTEQTQLRDARTMARLSGLAQLLIAGDQPGLAGLITPYVVSQQIERVLVFDADHRPLLVLRDGSPSADLGAAEGPDLALLVRQESSGGDKFVALAAAGGETVLYTSAPIYQGSQRVGTLLVGTPAPRLLERWRAAALADVTLYTSDGLPLATSLGPDRLPALGAAAPTAAPLRRSLLFGSRAYGEVVTALTLRGQPARQYIGVALSTAGRSTIIGRAEVLLLLIFAAGFGATILIGVILGRRIASPLSELARATHIIGAGDFSQLIQVRSRDEIGALGDAFNGMMRRLRAANDEIVVANQSIQQLNGELMRLNDDLFESLARFFDARDPYVGGHAAKVAEYATAIALELRLPPERVARVRQAALLHDIGKIAIPEALLNKPTRLTEQEYAELKSHVEIGAQLLEQSHGLRHLAPFVRHHHERWDGRGYPAGLHRHKIPLEARILNVCDSVEAMASDRPYHHGLSFSEIIAELQRCAGSQFDPMIAEVFIKIAEREGPEFIGNSAHEVSRRQGVRRAQWS